MARTHFNDKRHFCNYCRKIIINKTHKSDFYGKQTYYIININEALSYAWEKGLKMEMVNDLANINPKVTVKEFNKQMKEIQRRYM